MSQMVASKFLAGSHNTRHEQHAASCTKIESGSKEFGNCLCGMAIAATTGFTDTTVTVCKIVGRTICM